MPEYFAEVKPQPVLARADCGNGSIRAYSRRFGGFVWALGESLGATILQVENLSGLGRVAKVQEVVVPALIVSDKFGNSFCG